MFKYNYMRYNLFMLLCLLAISTTSNAQQKKLFFLTLNGVVTDAKTKQPLQNAIVEVFDEGKKYVGRYTNSEGRFNFRGAHLSEAVIKVRMEGYKPVEIKASKKRNGPYKIKLKREKKKKAK